MGRGEGDIRSLALQTFLREDALAEDIVRDLGMRWGRGTYGEFSEAFLELVIGLGMRRRRGTYVQCSGAGLQLLFLLVP